MAIARVTKSKPCPICGKPDWCGVTEGGELAICMRVESDKETAGSDGSVGWIHVLSDPLPTGVAATKAEKLSSEEVTRMAIGMFAHQKAPETRERLADELGVSTDSMERLGVGWSADYGGEFASFPSKDSKSRVIGITRRYFNGGKKTFPGTRNGLFYAKGTSQFQGPIFIPEGASDVAAFLTVGLCAVGRPSNTGGVAMLKGLLLGLRRTLIVVAERDHRREGVACAEDCTGCQSCFPGKYGAEVTARELGCRWCFPPEGYKDFREYVAAGGRAWNECLVTL